MPTSDPGSLQRVSFTVEQTEVVGVLHLPLAGKAGRAAVLHGYGGEPDQPHIVETCEALASVGIGALRFAYRDHRPPRMTLDGALADVKGALSLLGSHPSLGGPLALVGFSFGGTVAALAAGDRSSIAAVVLAAAPASFPPSAAGPDRDAVAALARSRAKALLVWGSRDQEVPLSHAERYRAAVPKAELVRIEGGDHDFGPASARARMTLTVADWLSEALR